jgi:hypothetical protein
VTAYVWAAGLYGDVAARGVTVPVDASLIDILENSDSLVGLQGRLAVGRGPVAVVGQDYSTGSGRQRFE